MARASYRLVVGTFVLLASCGGQGSTTDSQSPSSTQVITYRLIPGDRPFATTGSVIAFVPPETIPPAPPAPLEGTFEVIPVSPAPPNSGLAYSITRLEFTSDGYAISGATGYIETTTLDLQHPLIFTATVMINGERVQLAGGGGSGTFTTDSPPVFTDVALFDEHSYFLRVSAVPIPAP